MTGQEPIETSDMLAVHAALRGELHGLHDLVVGVPEGDVDRAAIVAEHYALVMQFLGVHHHGEDELLWPVLRSRRSESVDLFDRMIAQHADLDALLAGNADLLQAWTATADTDARDRLAAGIAALAVSFDAHSAQEEAEILPIAAVTMSAEEWAGLGEHARGALMAEGPMAMGVALGSILDRASPEVADAMLAEMPPPAREAWQAEGAPAYRAYRDRLVGTG